MVKPQILIIGKTLYNFVSLLPLAWPGYSSHFSWATPCTTRGVVLLLLLAAAGFSAILTFVSGIAAKAGDNPALPAILSIPLLFPQVITLSRISTRALTGFSWEVNAPYLLVLLLLAGVSLLLAYMLFAYLWRD
ncbi:MAG: hypothetical protein U5L96_11430 [Owenweeksia sp.]|nr:hypothetical protein [Owenweeksia sp.]